MGSGRVLNGSERGGRCKVRCWRRLGASGRGISFSNGEEVGDSGFWSLRSLIEGGWFSGSSGPGRSRVVRGGSMVVDSSKGDGGVVSRNDGESRWTRKFLLWKEGRSRVGWFRRMRVVAINGPHCIEIGNG